MSLRDGRGTPWIEIIRGTCENRRLDRATGTAPNEHPRDLPAADPAAILFLGRFPSGISLEGGKFTSRSFLSGIYLVHGGFAERLRSEICREHGDLLRTISKLDLSEVG